MSVWSVCAGGRSRTPFGPLQSQPYSCPRFWGPVPLWSPRFEKYTFLRNKYDHFQEVIMYMYMYMYTYTHMYMYMYMGGFSKIRLYRTV